MSKHKAYRRKTIWNTVLSPCGIVLIVILSLALYQLLKSCCG